MDKFGSSIAWLSFWLDNGDENNYGYFLYEGWTDTQKFFCFRV